MKKSSNLVGRDQLLNLSDGDISAGYAEELCDPNLKHGEERVIMREREREGHGTSDKLHLKETGE